MSLILEIRQVFVLLLLFARVSACFSRAQGDRYVFRSVRRQLYALLYKNVSCLVAIDALVAGDPIDNRLTLSC